MSRTVAMAILATAVCLGALIPACAAADKTAAAAAVKNNWPAPPAGARVVADGWFAPVPPVKRPPLPRPVQRAFVIPIHDAITGTTYEAVRRKVLRCRTGGAQLVIFDMNSPGGASDAMDDIVQLILNDLGDVYTVAYVNPKAFSAAAVISLACNEIVMTPTGVIGDAMPIMIGPEGLVAIPDKERGKLESAARSQIRVLANRNGYNQSMCEAMITITMEIWLIRNRTTGELRIVDAADWKSKVAGEPVASTTAPVAPSSAEWEYVRTLDRNDELVTMTADEAVEYGFVRNVLPTMADLQRHYDAAVAPVLLGDTWSEDLVSFLTSPTVTGVLFFVGILCLYIEFNAPGHIVPGIVGVICFAVIFGSRYLVGMAQWWEIALFVVGVLLVLVELVAIPGFGLVGILGIVMCIMGLVAMLVPAAPGTLPIPQSPLEWAVFTDSAVALACGLVAAVAAAFALARYLPKMPVANKLVLAPAAAADEPPVTNLSPIRNIRPGDIGVVESVCRPVGKVRFGEHLLDASSEGEPIEPSARVRVLRNDGNRIIVERVQ